MYVYLLDEDDFGGGTKQMGLEEAMSSGLPANGKRFKIWSNDGCRIV